MHMRSTITGIVSCCRPSGILYQPVPAPAIAASKPVPWPRACFAAQEGWRHNRAHFDVQLMIRVARTRPILVLSSIGLRMPTRRRTSKVAPRLVPKMRSVVKLIRAATAGHSGSVAMTPFGFLELLAAEIPEANLVLVGDATCPIDRCDSCPNVHRFGFRPYGEIPASGRASTSQSCYV